QEKRRQLRVLVRHLPSPTSELCPWRDTLLSTGLVAGLIRRPQFRRVEGCCQDRSMPQKVRIALDAMGGDVGASVVVQGAAIALQRYPNTEFLLLGDRAKIEPLLVARAGLREAARIIHTDVAIKMDDKPSQALRSGRWKSSMWLSLDAVKRRDADV